MSGVVRALLQALAFVVIFKYCVSATILNQNGCYNTDIILNCPHYTPNKPGKLVWRFRNEATRTWTEVASINRKGNRSLSRYNSTLYKRLTIHPNGSLGIASLHPDDETMYQCKTYMEETGLRLHVTSLKVSCGRVTKDEQEVCAEDDVVLDCEAKHRTNPRKMTQIKWHKKNVSGSDVSWSLLVTTIESNGTVGNAFQLHGNGSLVLQGGREESEVTYKCDVTKNVASPLDRHIIVVKSVKCQREKHENKGTVKTTIGRAAVTKPIVVAMETSTPPSRAVSSTLGSNHIFIYLVISWVLVNFKVKL